MTFRVTAAQAQEDNLTVTLNDGNGNEMTTVFEGAVSTAFSVSDGFATVNFHCASRSGEDPSKFLNRPPLNF